MIGLQCDRAAKLDSTNPDAAKIQAIWAGLFSKSAAPEELWAHKLSLEEWMNKHKSEIRVPPSISFDFKDTALVFVTEDSPSLPSNALPIGNMNDLNNLTSRLLQVVKIEYDNPRSKEKILNLLFQLAAFDEGRELLEEIVNLIGTEQIRLREGSNFEIGDGNTIMINCENEFNVLVFPDRSSPGDTILRSTQAPTVIGLAHELLHLIHSLKQKENKPYPPKSAMEILYTDTEEFRTIQGTPTSHLTEASIGQAMGIGARYGHIEGNHPSDDWKEAMKYSVKHGINGDLEWIVPKIPTAEKIKSIYKKYKRKIKKKLIRADYWVIRGNLRRSSPARPYSMPITSKILSSRTRSRIFLLKELLAEWSHRGLTTSHRALQKE